jgi:hypothetical protein
MKQVKFFFLRALFVSKSICKIITDRPQITDKSLFDGLFPSVSLSVSFVPTDYEYKYR